MSHEKYIPKNIQQLYEIHDFKHAAAIIANEFSDEFKEICKALKNFRFTKQDVLKAGGNESQIPKTFSNILRPNWVEDTLTAKMIVDGKEICVDTHKVDYIRNRVAFDLEWNSKDQTFDRDLYAFRAFFDYDRISVGVLVTRSNELDTWFKVEKYKNSKGKIKPLIKKYGASTTHMAKLLPRLEAGRNGGCPVLVFGITSSLLV